MAEVAKLNPELHQEYKRGVQFLVGGRWVEAEAVYRRVVAQRPDLADAHHNLGIALKSQGKSQEAMAAFRTSLALRPDFPDVFNSLGDTLRGLKQLDASIAAFRRALSLRSNFPEANNNLGIALRDAERLDEAADAFKRALAQRPSFPEACNNLGATLRELDRLPEAVEIYRQCVALRPDYPEAWANLGSTLATMKRQSEAVEPFRKAVALRPDNPEFWNNLGNVLHDTKQPEEAVEAYKRALNLNADYADAWLNLGIIMRDLHQPAKAIEASRRALALDPDSIQAWSNLAGALNDMGEFDEVLACFATVIAMKPDDAVVHGSRLCTLHYNPAFDDAAILREARQWNDRFVRPLGGEIPLHANDRSPGRRLRIGYVSPDFRKHCEALFLTPLFANHNHREFEIVCYSNVETPDAVTARLQGHADLWRDITKLTEAEVAQLVQKDKIDILVDLALHTSKNRLLVFARKPAPIQVTWLGYPGTTGVETIDYRLTDNYLDPLDGSSEAISDSQAGHDPGHSDSSKSEIRADEMPFVGVANQKLEIAHPGTQQPFYSERSYHLPDSFWCYDPRGMEEADATPPPEPGPLPALTAGHFTFGCLNNYCKVTDQTLALWAKVMAALPTAHLFLVAPLGAPRERVLQRLGVAPERVEFVVFQPWRKYLESYRRIDLCLDTIPFNGGTTGLDALWMGVPILTRVGWTVVGRAGASHLHNLGMGELVAHSDEEFVEKAVAWGGDLQRLGDLHATLRRRMENSPLMDGARFARNIEAAYRQMWQSWCGPRA